MADRLADLLRHYSFSAHVFHSGTLCGQYHYTAPHGYIHLVRRGPITARSPVHEDPLVAEPSLLFYPCVTSRRFVAAPSDTAEQLCAKASLGASTDNPLTMALPSMLLIPLTDLPGLRPTLELLFAEAGRNQYSRQTAVDRLCGLLLIRLLRCLTDGRLGVTGLLAGLVGPKLARAITAMHDAPQTAWSLKALAAKAGMSHTRFAIVFKSAAGTTPDDCLTGWWMNVNCTLLKQGRSMAVMTDHIGYGSLNALAHASRVRTGYALCGWLAQQRGDVALSGS